MLKDRSVNFAVYKLLHHYMLCQCLTSRTMSEVTRVAVVDEQFRCVYDTLVKPDNPIIDYVTR